MSVILNDLLALVGRLDDSPGFDTPRERFRRFLLDRVSDPGVARSLIDQSQRSLDEQHHRSLQDAIVVLGRFLGFETGFGTYQRVAGAAKHDGQWRSRRRLEVVLDVRTDETPRSDLDELSRALSGLAASSRSDVPHLGLVIVTPLYGGRARLDDAVHAEKSLPDVRVVSIRSLLWLADMVSAGRLKHHEIVRLLTSGASLDFVVDLLERFATGAEESAEENAEGSGESSVAAEGAAPSVRSEPAYWVATIDRDETATPEQFVESVIRRRQILGVNDGGADLRARAGDWICFSVRGKGTVGHARVDSVINGTSLIRGSDRFTGVFRLTDTEIYDAPIALDPETEQKRLAEPVPADQHGPFLGPVSREEFAELTARALESRAEAASHAG
jgi:hypothetical protein